MSVSVAGIPKNRCRTTVAERMVETRAELPFTGDQVGLFRARPGRPKRTCNSRVRPVGSCRSWSHRRDRNALPADIGEGDMLRFGTRQEDGRISKGPLSTPGTDAQTYRREPRASCPIPVACNTYRDRLSCWATARSFCAASCYRPNLFANTRNIAAIEGCPLGQCPPPTDVA